MRTATEGIDYTSRDYLAYKELLIQKLQENMPEYTDTSESDAGIVILEAFANGLDICSYYTDALANDLILSTTQDRKIARLLAIPLGYTPYNQTSSEVPMVFVLDSVKEEDTIISRNTVVKTEESEDLEPVSFLTQEDLVIPKGCLGDEKDENDKYKYTVIAKQGELVDEDYIGSSIGTPNQSFLLSYTEVLVDSLELYIDEGNGEELWERVNNFIDSTPLDKVYTVTVDEYNNCYIMFGNGAEGKIPSAHDNGIRATYMTGGGIDGNVSDNTITELDTNIDGIDHIFNLEPIVYGHEKESLEEIKYNAPANWRTRDRAITLEDYEDLLKTSILEHDSFYAIMNTKAIQNEENDLLVDLYYQMEEDYEMTEELKEEILDFFSRRTIIGTSVNLIPFVEYKVDLTISLIVDSDYIKEEVEQDVKDELESYFHYGNFTFGDIVIKSELEKDILDVVDGVISFRISTPANDIIETDKDYKIISLGDITLNTTVR